MKEDKQNFIHLLAFGQVTTFAFYQLFRPSSIRDYVTGGGGSFLDLAIRTQKCKSKSYIEVTQASEKFKKVNIFCRSSSVEDDQKNKPIFFILKKLKYFFTTLYNFLNRCKNMFKLFIPVKYYKNHHQNFQNHTNPQLFRLC